MRLWSTNQLRLLILSNYLHGLLKLKKIKSFLHLVLQLLKPRLQLLTKDFNSRLLQVSHLHFKVSTTYLAVLLIAYPFPQALSLSNQTQTTL